MEGPTIVQCLWPMPILIRACNVNQFFHPIYDKHAVQTSRVSLPPTMLKPSPLFPLLISMVVSRPGIMGQEAGSCMTVAAAGVSDERCRVGDDEEKTGATATTGWRDDDAVSYAGD